MTIDETIAVINELPDKGEAGESLLINASWQGEDNPEVAWFDLAGLKALAAEIAALRKSKERIHRRCQKAEAVLATHQS